MLERCVSIQMYALYARRCQRVVLFIYARPSEIVQIITSSQHVRHMQFPFLRTSKLYSKIMSSLSLSSRHLNNKRIRPQFGRLGRCWYGDKNRLCVAGAQMSSTSVVYRTSRIISSHHSYKTINEKRFSSFASQFLSRSLSAMRAKC